MSAATRKLKLTLDRIEEQLEQIAKLLPHMKVSAPKISGWSVGLHLEHLLLSAKRISQFVAEEKERPSPGKVKVALLGKIILFTGFIPRGRGKSPDVVMPHNATREELQRNLDSARKYLVRVRQHIADVLASSSVFPHPIFGNLSPQQWLRFMSIHQNHHLRIIKDILKSAKGSS